MQARQRVARRLRFAAGLFAILWGPSAFGGSFPVFGPEDFVRAANQPVPVTREFQAPSPAAVYTLRIINGGASQQLRPVSSAVVKLNGVKVAAPKDFNQNVRTIEKPVSLNAQNHLEVELHGTPGSGFHLIILGEDDEAPTIAITAPHQSVIQGDPTPDIAVTYSDALSGVNVSSLRITLDGTALTGCAVGATSVTCEPPPLASGDHTVTAEVKDRAGNLSTASFPFRLALEDSIPPAIQILSPLEGSFVPSVTPQIKADFSDIGSGINVDSISLVLDGTDRTAEAQKSVSGLIFVPGTPLAEGAHSAEITIRDRVGNETRSPVSFAIDSIAPNVAIVDPAELNLSDITTATIRVTYSDNGSGLDSSTLRIVLDEIDLTPGCTVGATSAACQTSTLSAGIHPLSVRLQDRVGNLGSAGFTFAIDLDQQSPALTIKAPDRPLIVGDPSPAVRVEYSDSRSGIDTASLRVLVDETDLTGTCQIGPSFATCEPLALMRGMHTVSAQVADQRGNLATASFGFALTFPLEISFTEPEPDFLMAVPAVRVAGIVSPEATSVKVNGVAADLASGVFTIDSLGLHDGVNDLIAVAEDAAGNFGSAAVRVVADTTSPVVSVTFPAPNAALATPTVSVTGLVNDLAIGTVSDTQATVTVNGIQATVENRTFVVSGVPLQPGVNMLMAVARDRAGNEATAAVQVTREDRTGLPSIRGVSGDGQSGLVSTALPQPLVVGVTDGAGQPMAGIQVVFRVDQGNGVLPGGERIMVVPTNAQGLASTLLTLGTRAGVGADRVRATAVGFTGEVNFVASALTGVPAAIHVASGDNQRGAVAGELSRPLFAVVTDDGDNPVAGVPVTFQVTGGGGGFVESGGADTAAAETDESGLASVHLTLGPAPGFDNNLVEAAFAGLTSLPAIFKQSSFLPGNPAETRISGVVLDNEGDSVPGVTMRLRDSVLTTVTDAEGKFLLNGVPLGQVFLIADATTTTRPGSWASLEFELFTLPGVDNTMPRPIYILPIDLPNGVYVDETRGGTVTVPGIPGVSLEVAPGSVTFPGGGRSGVVSVTAVKADKIPMPPGAGMQPRLIVTIQPVGAHFDPPAPFSLPNVDGLALGTVTELFSFDHDLGEFVSIGTGTVSDDGLVVQSDPGFGIVEAGWHCGAPPSGQGSGGQLSVRLSPRPIKIQYGSTTGVIAQGRPPLDGEYLNWKIENPTFDTEIRFTSQPSCPDQQSCANQVSSKGLVFNGQNASFQACGTATAKVSFRCKTTNKIVTDTVPLEQGCSGKSARECQSICNSERVKGMCGTPCEFTGTPHPGFNPGSGGKCWRTLVGSTWYCYWDHKTPDGTGFANLCCPNRCYGGSFTVWGQGEGEYACTVIERCAANPSFGGLSPDGEPGARCQPVE
jgi:hypothetical protein